LKNVAGLRRVGGELRPGAADVEQPVVVASGDARLGPRLGPEGLEVVFLGEPCQTGAREVVEQRLEGLAME
jgi:hypothetical protein